MATNIAQMDFLQMLRAGQALPSVAAHTIHEHAMSLKQRAKTLKQQYKAADAKFRYCKGLLAPIRALPRELLMHIFMLVGDTSTSPDGARVVIGRVCRHWLSITKSFPAFWSKIDISYSSSADLRRVARLEILARCLVLSNPRLLDLSLDIYEAAGMGIPDGPLGLVFDLLLGHVCRFRSFKLIGSWDGIEAVHEFLAEQELSKLETLHIQYRGEYEDTDLLNLQMPALHTLTLNFSGFETYLDSSQRLTTYSGLFDHDKQFYTFLCAASNLNSLHVMHIGPNPDHPPFTPFKPQVLPSLQKLSLQFCSISTIFKHFRFPNLERLAIPNMHASKETHPPDCDEGPFSIIRALVKRSQCSLRELEIGYYVWPSECLPLFKLCASSITTLHIDFYADNEDDIVPTAKLLTVSEDTAILPHLTDLAILVCSSSAKPVFTLGETEKMIKSRVGGISPLKRLRLERKACPGSMTAVGLRASSLAIILRDLKREGFDVTWIVAKKDMLEE